MTDDITININTGLENNEPKVTTTADNATAAIPKAEIPKDETPKAETMEQKPSEKDEAK